MFFRQQEAHQQHTRDYQNLSDMKPVGIGFYFANFSELGQKRAYLLSVRPPYKRQHKASHKRSVFSHLRQPIVQISPSI